MKKMTGVVVAMTTPFTENGSVDHGTLEQTVDFLVDAGVQCLYPCGTTGEMLLLSVEERKALAETVIRRCAGRVNVFVQCGAATQDQTIDLIAHAKANGADGAGVVTPAYFGLDVEEMTAFYKAVSDRAGADFPIYLYNIPQCSANDITGPVCARIAEMCPNVVGIKYSWNNPDRMADYLSVRDYGFSVLVGTERSFLPYLALGCDGVVSGCANAFPELFVRLYRDYLAGDLDGARAEQRRIDALVRLLTEDRSIARVKAAQQMRGMGTGIMRAPLLPVDPAALESLRRQLQPFLP